ncbi:helix-turn-helix transcriptional regulator [Paludisphaera rhizosphaerae]|uniref:helix-turn-helix transcriptional regulator n=1 Tax=Paludisphaera rhizosphaerae TaxID=2711216 RepID=UPI0013EAB819|nr:helix-turn-helix transcriptional regulator [Paludisphaera rhizosphaerae]
MTCWQQHLIEVLAGLTGGSIGFVGEMEGFRSKRPKHLSQAEWGWSCESDRAGYFAGFADYVRNPESYETERVCRRWFLVEDGISLSRTQLFDDRRWEATKEFQDIFRPLGARNALWCNRSIPGAAGDFSLGIHLMRAGRPRDFNARERAVVYETQAALAPLVGGPLAQVCDPSPAALPPQARRVLQCLLEGDGDKQIAARMKLSRYTVNQYMKVVFRHFRVRSRAELMARWIRRGWSVRSIP